MQPMNSSPICSSLSSFLGAHASGISLSATTVPTRVGCQMWLEDGDWDERMDGLIDDAKVEVSDGESDCVGSGVDVGSSDRCECEIVVVTKLVKGVEDASGFKLGDAVCGGSTSSSPSSTSSRSLSSIAPFSACWCGVMLQRKSVV
jgi:hypothetical protein